MPRMPRTPDEILSSAAPSSRTIRNMDDGAKQKAAAPQEISVASALASLGVRLVSSDLIPQWSEGSVKRRMLIGIQEGLLGSPDLGRLRCRVSVLVDSDYMNKKSRVRASLFSPATFEWKEVHSIGFPLMKSTLPVREATEADGGARVFQSLRNAGFKFCPDSTFTDKLISDGYAPEYQELVMYNLLHQKLSLAIEAGSQDQSRFIAADLVAAWEHIHSMYAA